MKSRSYVFFCLIILLTGVMYFPIQAQQKKGTHRVDFSGEWKSKVSISIGGNIFCVYEEGDRMSSKTMKIVDHIDFLTIQVPKPSPGKSLVTSHEKLNFDGKESQLNYGHDRRKKFTINWSADGQTMSVNTFIHQKQAIFNVTEVWKLSKDGKSITIQTNATSNMADASSSVKPFSKLQTELVKTEVPTLATILKNKENTYTTISRVDGLEERSWKTVFVKAN